MTVPATKHNRIIQNTVLAFFLGAGLWTALLIRASMLIQNEKAATQVVACGPFLLNTITRHQDAHGITASISFHSGLLWLGISCIAVGIVVSVAQNRLERSNTTEA